MRKAVVTGATSFIGAPLVKKLIDEGFFVYAVVRPHSTKLGNLELKSNLKVVECDLKDVSHLPLLIRDKCFAFYHIAWNGTRVPERDDPLIQNDNYLRCIEAYEAAKKLGCSYFISTGSQAEYGRCDGVVGEDFPTNPTTEYGRAKLKSFIELKRRNERDQIRLGWVRIFSAYGPGDYEKTLIMYAISRMLKDEDVEMTLGLQNWNYIYIGDVVNILFLLSTVDNYKAESYNVCSDDNRMLRDYMVELKDTLKSKSRLLFGTKKYNESEGIISFKPLNTNVKKLLGYNAFTPFKEGVLSVWKNSFSLDGNLAKEIFDAPAGK